MENAPRVAIVIAARNIDDFLAKTLQSVCAQEFSSFEVIVIADSCTDNTAGVAREFADQDQRFSVFERQAGGVSVARNAGLEKVRAAIILFLDGDDLLTKDALTKLVSALDEHPDAIASIGGHDKIDEQDQRIAGETAQDRDGFQTTNSAVSILSRNTIVNGGTMAIRTEAARSVGGFDARLKHGEDWEFWCRLALLGPFVGIGQHTVLLYRQRRGSAYSSRGLSSFNDDAIAIAFEHARKSGKIPETELSKLERNAKISDYWATARATAYSGHKLQFLRLFVYGLWRYPDSLWRGFLLKFIWRKISSKVNISGGNTAK